MHLVFVMFVVRDVSLALDQFWHPITELNADTIKNMWTQLCLKPGIHFMWCLLCVISLRKTVTIGSC